MSKTKQVLMLAGPGVMVATIMMACFSKYVFPYEWDWNTCLFFGAMTSATDPVAVVALMKVSFHRQGQIVLCCTRLFSAAALTEVSL